MRSNLGIYEPLGEEGYELCHPLRKEDFDTIRDKVDGTPRHASWSPIPMQLVGEDEGKELVRSDAPWLGSHALIFRPSVIEALGPMLYEHGELLALGCSEADLVMYNPTRVIDALDEAASSVVRFTSGRIMMIQRHVFRTDAIGQLDIFKIPNMRSSPTFVSDRFVDRWRASGLTGLEFRQVWIAQN